MNNKIIVFVLIGCIFCFINVFSQQAEIAKEQTSTVENEKLEIEDLNLSETQQQQLEEIKKSIALDRSSLKQNSHNNKDSSLKMVEDYQQKMSEAFEKILTKEQHEIYLNNLKVLEEMKTLKPNVENESNQ